MGKKESGGDFKKEKMKRSFASDNNAGVSPEIIEAIRNANKGDFLAYGDDPYTKCAEEKFKEVFGHNVKAFFVTTGTGANVLSLSALLKPFQAVISAESAHINTDECGAPEKFTGSKILTVKTPDGKLTPELIEPILHTSHGEHQVVPKVVSITEATELGTVYTVEEIRKLTDFAHKKELFVHMDGARIANAAAHLGCNFIDITGKAGVDILSFGGTKNGMLLGEAVVFFRPELAENFKFIRKQGGQLLSKMRFISAQFLAYFENDLWRRNALNANQMAKLLESKVKSCKKLEILFPVESNALFAKLPKDKIEALQEKSFFYVWDEISGVVRWMTNFLTTEKDVEEFAGSVFEVLGC